MYVFSFAFASENNRKLTLRYSLLCKINIDEEKNTREDIIKKLKNKAKKLYKNREEQNIDLLKQYKVKNRSNTIGNELSGEKNSKSKSKKKIKNIGS